MPMINPSIKQVGKLNIYQIQSYIRYLITLNRTSDQKEDERTNKFGIALVQRYHQLPCNHSTRIRRAELFEKLVGKDKKICLIGDDDLVCVELVKRGFQKITVYDCDYDLMSRIESIIPKENKDQIRLCIANAFDLSQLEASFADLIAFDPPYHSEGLMAFSKAALHCARKDSPYYLICMTIPHLFHNRDDDWYQFLACLEQEQIILDTHYRGFNCYPLPFFNQFVLRFFAKVLTPTYRVSGKRNLAFFSDCLVFKRDLDLSIGNDL